ncbi:hypothetical protein BDU57DRAFT_570833 [Ampelomyces quisqualis]|uniref:Uncharacterized protein n=1 Tax=Ampelomyces quisqualis TaxID=50730 RepID=A0A6A5QP13_AMPQU|nr:hypothetical protein BDU57DRAFT_570833 [Ampelomyces quisqualis]
MDGCSSKSACMLKLSPGATKTLTFPRFVLSDPNSQIAQISPTGVTELREMGATWRRLLRSVPSGHAIQYVGQLLQAQPSCARKRSLLCTGLCRTQCFNSDHYLVTEIQ